MALWVFPMGINNYVSISEHCPYASEQPNAFFISSLKRLDRQFFSQNNQVERGNSHLPLPKFLLLADFSWKMTIFRINRAAYFRVCCLLSTQCQSQARKK
jgi:hypothetical protein